MNNATRNWKTTLAGILALAMTGLSVYSNPALIQDPTTIAGIVGGIGLIVAKDGDKGGTSAKPTS